MSAIAELLSNVLDDDNTSDHAADSRPERVARCLDELVGHVLRVRVGDRGAGYAIRATSRWDWLAVINEALHAPPSWPTRVERSGISFAAGRDVAQTLKITDRAGHCVYALVLLTPACDDMKNDPGGYVPTQLVDIYPTAGGAERAAFAVVAQVARAVDEAKARTVAGRREEVTVVFH